MHMQITFGWPQRIWLFLAALSLIISVSCHGQPREPHSGPTTFLGLIISIGLLYWGGFFG